MKKFIVRFMKFASSLALSTAVPVLGLFINLKYPKKSAI
ncbi:Uncharacterised protein [Clostridioides difficile]|nr:Uncharacterised protein [Clostridioides difficile]